MADLEDKLDELSGMVHELKPVVFEIRENQRYMDARIRDFEIKYEGHEAKIDHLIIDSDSLGKKIRACEMNQAIERGDSKLFNFLEVLAILPRYWHIIMSLVMAAATAITIAWRRAK